MLLVAPARLFRTGAVPARFTLACLLAIVVLGSQGRAHASCDVIPGVTAEFRGALGTLNRPYAIPGDVGQQLKLTLKPQDCDTASPGFVDLPGGSTREDDYFVTVLFTPPQGAARNAVILTTGANLGTCESRISDPNHQFCRVVLPGTQELEISDPTSLSFRFPDTDAELAPDGDDRTFTGPAAIAVTPVSSPLPFELATGRCADTTGLVACIDELYAHDGTCETSPTHVDSVFGHFTALPPANDYQALCTTSQTECTGLASELRFTVDDAGNALVPMDWRGVLLRPDGIPVPRLVRGDTAFEAFVGGGKVRIPGRSFLASYAPGGQRLPPIFEPLADPLANPNAQAELTLFGSSDAPVSIIRLARRMADLTGLLPVYRECTGGVNQGLPCVLGEECPGGTCGQTTCRGTGVAPGTLCTSDGDCPIGECGPTLFDFSNRLSADSSGDRVGPVLVSDYTIDVENPVPLEGLIESPELFAFVRLEAIEGPDGTDLNGDGDTTDPVLVLRDRQTGETRTIGALGSQGRAVTRIRQPPFSFPAVAVESDIAAFLEPEPLQGDCSVSENCDHNGDGDVFDTILRIYHVDQDCPGDAPCTAEELTTGMNLAVDATPLIDDRSLAISDGLVFFRLPEAANARQDTVRVSINSAGEEGNARSRFTSISGDGRRVAFRSSASNLGNLMPHIGLDHFLHDLLTGETIQVSVASDGTPSNGQFKLGTNSPPSLSADGFSVAFSNGGDNLVDGDTNDNCPEPPTNNSFPRDNCADIFVHDTDTGLITRVSVSSDGAQANLASEWPSISQDGRFVAFHSRAGNLVSDDTNNEDDVFVHDRELSTTIRVSRFDATDQIRRSFVPTISADGRVVAFVVEMEPIPPSSIGRTIGLVHELDTGVTEVFSISSAGEKANVSGAAPVGVSADGRYITFWSHSTNLVPGDTGSGLGVFLRDRKTATTSMLSINSAGRHAKTFGQVAPETRPSPSADGRFTPFGSDADNLVADDTNGERDIFVRDQLTGLTMRVSVDGAGQQVLTGGSFGSFNASISADGRYVAFASGAENLVEGDENAPEGQPSLGWDIFVRGPSPEDLESDLNGDGDLDDTVLHVFDTRSRSLFRLGPAGMVVTAAGSAAFMLPESASGIDRNGDGDTGDKYVHLWVGRGEARTVEPVDLDRDAVAIAMSADVIAALVPSGAGGEAFVEIFDRRASEPGWNRVGPAASVIAVDELVVAFITTPGGEVQVFDVAAGAMTPPLGSAEEFVLGEQKLAFRTPEAGEVDLNGDDDTEDHVLHVYDVASGLLFNTGQAVIPCGFEACDPRVPYRISGDTVTFLTLEADQSGPVLAPGCQPTGTPGECDLDGNGDARGIVIQTFNVRQAAEMADISRAAVAGLPALSLHEARECVTSLAGVSAGICTDTGVGCATNEDCPAGICFVPPGGCIEDLGTTCSCESGECVGCQLGEFCVPTPDLATCHVRLRSCQSDADCPEPTAFCQDAAQDIVRLLGPVAPQHDGRQVFVSAGMQTMTGGSECMVDEECDSNLGEACNEAGRCQLERMELIIVGAPDTDGDGVADPFDNCPQRSNADQADVDEDQAGDLCDRDNDNDEVLDESDNCPLDSNPAQLDADADALGDACDPDDDNDAVLDGVDNCTLAANAAQIDVDGDGYGNACDCDFNQDGICDGFDEFIYLLCVNEIFPAADPNCAESDMNADGVVDAADQALLFDGQPTMSIRPPGPSSCIQSDADIWCDFADNCPFVANPGQEDCCTPGLPTGTPDGIGDACQCGDVTGDGEVNSFDATMIKRQAISLSAPLFNIPGNCDVTGDGNCNSFDATMITRKALGLSAPLFGDSCPNFTGGP